MDATLEGAPRHGICHLYRTLRMAFYDSVARLFQASTAWRQSKPPPLLPLGQQGLVALQCLCALVTLLASLVAVGAAQPPIRIGASLSLTGTYAALGQHQQRGYQLYAQHV